MQNLNKKQHIITKGIGENMKLCVLGGGGARSVFLTKSLVKSAEEIKVDHIVLMDNNEQKLMKYGALSKGIAAKINPSIQFDITIDAREALKNADYIITTLRVGGDEARRFDEEACLKLGVLGQETTGAGGFAMAIRSVPVLIEYCKLAKEVANPTHLIFNFTNPSGIVTQALRSSGFSNVYGICDAPSGFIKQLEEVLGVGSDGLSIECYGLNHLSWFRNASANGKAVQYDLLMKPETYKNTELRLFDYDMCSLNGNCMLNEYLYFYYSREKSLKLIKQAEHPRGEMIYYINKELEEELEKVDIQLELEKAFNLYMNSYAKRENAYFSVESGSERPHSWKVPTIDEFIDKPDEGGYAAVALKFIKAVTNGNKTQMVLSVPNEEAIDGLAPDDVVEITCTIDKQGAHPINIGIIDEFQLLQIKRIKYFERCTIKAILEGDRDSAVKGLYIHPLVNDMEVARELADIFFKKYSIYMENISIS
ncbi:6-phospho-beta-glucosidase [Clostridium swellfunianum]|nr:6-phospho-beta-glucosidase [Clostridium swellfunianum]